MYFVMPVAVYKTTCCRWRMRADSSDGPATIVPFYRLFSVFPTALFLAVTPANTLFCNININVWPGEQLTSTEGCRWTCSVLRSWHGLGIFFSLFMSNNTYLTPIYSMFSLDGLHYFFLVDGGPGMLDSELWSNDFMWSFPSLFLFFCVLFL